MSDTPKSESANFEFVDRRKLKAQEEQTADQTPETETPPAPPPAEVKPGPRLVVEETRSKSAVPEPPAAREQSETGHQEPEPELELPPAPTAQESKKQKAAYDASAQRIEDMARAQNPGMGAQPPLTFEHLIQQFYVSALIQMGAGAQEGQRPQVDILGARGTIDLLGILAEKTRGNLTPAEDRMLQAILYELRMMFLEITGMIAMPNLQPPPEKR